MAHAFLHEVAHQPTEGSNATPSFPGSSSKLNTHNQEGSQSRDAPATAHLSSQTLSDRLQSQNSVPGACGSRKEGAQPPAQSGQLGDATWTQDNTEAGAAADRGNEPAVARALSPEAAMSGSVGGKSNAGNVMVTSPDGGSQKRQRQAVAGQQAGISNSSSGSAALSCLVPCDPASLHAAPLQWYPVTTLMGDVVIADAVC